MLSRRFESSQEWTLEIINGGIAKLLRRIGELQVLLDTPVKYDDPIVRNAESEIPATIQDVFGKESREYKEWSYVRLRSEIISEGAHESALAAEHRKQNEFTQRVSQNFKGWLRALRRRRKILRSVLNATALIRILIIA